MKRLSQQLKRALDALAFAHVGENLTPRQMYEELADKEAPAAAVAHPAPRLRLASVTPLQRQPQVALLTDSGLSAEVVQYAMQSCRQLGAGLIFLTMGALPSKSVLETYQGYLRAAGIPFTTVTLPKGSNEELVAFVQNQPRLHYLIVSGSGSLPAAHAPLQWQLPVPLVVVSSQPPHIAKPAV